MATEHPGGKDAWDDLEAWRICEKLMDNVRDKITEHHDRVRQSVAVYRDQILRLKLDLKGANETIKELTERARNLELDKLGLSQKNGELENRVKHLREQLHQERRIEGQEDQ